MYGRIAYPSSHAGLTPVADKAEDVHEVPSPGHKGRRRTAPSKTSTFETFFAQLLPQRFYRLMFFLLFEDCSI